MSETADVVIVGAGIVGSSIAYHLAQQGCTDIVILERETHPGKGSTGKSMGGVRAQFSTAVNVQLSLYSIRFFRTFDEVVGHPSGYRPQGYLFVATSEKHMDYLRTNHSLQVAMGLDTVRLLTREDIVAMIPQLRSDDIVGGTFCSTDGFVDPYSVMVGFLNRAVDKGAKLWRETEAIGLLSDETGISAVQTTKGTVSTRIVVNAAGAWAARVAQFAGVELPVEPLRRMLVPTEPFSLIPHTVPMVVDMTNGFHFRPEGPGLLLAWNDPTETPGFKTNFDPAFIEKILTHAVNRVPCLESAEVNPRRCWAGLYEMTPDHYPVLGPVSQICGLFLANGFSGHGVMHSPATGRILSDLILHGRSDLVDTHALGIERFAEGRLLTETAVL